MAAIMIQGTGSDVGKSVLVAGLCRAFANRGLNVRPFKPQNMSNNAAVTADGGEIGRAQATQALACRARASVDMNPVLLKPQGDRTSQLVVRGAVRGTLAASNWRQGRAGLLDVALESYHRLAAGTDLVVVEGAGSPAETNLRAGDIANMGFARAARVPVVLAGDIDRGGLIASLVGTHAVIDADDAAMIRGFLVNKFRGDPALFDDGMTTIEQRTGWRGLGIVPWLGAARRLPSEDAVVLERPAAGRDGRIVIACPVTPRIANFDDFDPLKLEPGVELVMVPPGRAIPDAAMIVLAGSKATCADLSFLRTQGWDIDIVAHHRKGRPVLGLCGGYQMLGRSVSDPAGIEGPPGSIAGLGLLAVDTVLGGDKALSRVTGTALGARFEGYEIHLGRTAGPDTARPVGRLHDGRAEGAVSADGLVAGSYVHGLLGLKAQRAAWLARIGVAATGPDHAADIDAALDEIAAALEVALDLEAMLAIAQG
ncbi:cobyric acid synthase [Sphingomonas sp.]|uniref:cobyric acid synthase n=1 Tax=Sphingomonas sp. TaxID=28214 RepID=UPI002CFB2A3E|nr:cobyric acid synthase [Sphingomonas sp.]HTG38756.1 cobyric acid synthase [Sphingomonas sp.]